MSDLMTVVLAAGKGTRMKSDTNKVLHKIAGKEMVNHVIDTAKEISSEVVCIVGYQAEKVKNAVTSEVKFRLQSEQLGTGHAVMQAREEIKNHDGDVLILYADIPLIKEETLVNMKSVHDDQSANLTIMTTLLKNPTGYGRIIKNEASEIVKIVEEDDASVEHKNINEINSGIMCIDSKSLNNALDDLDNDNAQEEYYLTDVVDSIRNQNGKIISYKIDNKEEITGVNDRVNLSKAEKITRKRINHKHMINGVTIIDPLNTYIDENVEIGVDTIIYPFTYIEGKSIIGSHNVIKPHNNIKNTIIGDNNNIKNSNVIKNSTIKNECNIGPFAHIRPGCIIADGVKIGDYVELKKADISEKTKVPHLAYVGDAEIGSQTNVGAGTIFANYDGKNKHKTIVGKSVFIGSNSTLVAPLKIEDRGKTGAGAVVTKDINEDTTVIGVPAREYMKSKDD
ncbi:MAG: bifunctional UDP-N-acetylglucosamine diphosphorylase/glucosamine-1-phosphate N-acetyltransferase GlmU [Halanaerobiales bacterium]